MIDMFDQNILLIKSFEKNFKFKILFINQFV